MSTTELAKQTSPEAIARKEFSKFMDGFKNQMALALPKHLNGDRMARLALTQFSANKALQECSPNSIAASVLTACSLGLEIGVNGQGYLIPYRGVCQFVPGWKGLQDIANRSNRCSTWTGAVFEGDEFDYALGDSPFVRHRPGDETDPNKLTHVYAIGRISGSEGRVIEVWTVGKCKKHRDRFNKVGARHYSYEHWEMYCRKIALLQVLKYMPASIELNNAMDLAGAQEGGKRAVLDGDFVVISDEEASESNAQTGADQIMTPVAKSKPAQTAATRVVEEGPRPSDKEQQGPSGPTQTEIDTLQNLMKFKRLTLIDACDAVGVAIPNSIAQMGRDAFVAVADWVNEQ
jgi:recombination protein RecT